MKTYTTSHSELTSAKPEHIWALWSDLSTWQTWDEGISDCFSNGSFNVGETFMLTPKGAPAPIEVTLVDVLPNTLFIDETKLPFGKIRASHTIREEGKAIRVTHTIEAEIDPQQAKFFEEVIWSAMVPGVKQSVRNIVKLAEGRS
jgi:Polyketide cyclase / dehydrase and lipid transport